MTGVALTVMTQGCAYDRVLLNRLMRDDSVHAQVAKLREKKQYIGHVSERSLTSGESLNAKAAMLGAEEVTLKGGSSTRMCFEVKYFLRFNDLGEKQIMREVTERLGGHSLSVRTHGSLDDFAEGKPWPQTTATTGDSRVSRVERVIGATRIMRDGTKQKDNDSHNVWVEFCAPPPAIDDNTKYLSFAVLGGDQSLALWQLSPAPASAAPRVEVQPPADAVRAPTDAPRAPVSPGGTTLFDVLASRGDCTTFLGIAEKAGMPDLLRGSEAFTALVMTDAEFAKHAPTLAKKLESASQAEAQTTLKKLVVKGTIALSTIDKSLVAQTLDGSKMTFQRTAAGEVKLNGGRVVQQEVPASNGVVFLLKGR